jgi:hypothetical protein
MMTVSLTVQRSTPEPLQLVTAAAASCDARKAIGGSILGRGRNIDRGFDEGFTRIN